MALDRCDGSAALQHIAHALRLNIESDDAANHAESLSLYGQWLAEHEGRPAEALRLWRALLHAPQVDAPLRDELATRIGELHCETSPAAHVAHADIALCAEQALAAAEQRSPDRLRAPR